MNKSVITTSWDDGFWLDVRVAELLDKYSLKGTFYVPKKFTKKPLTKTEIQEIAKRHEIGAHSLTHRDLTTLNGQELIKEIEDSKSYLEDIIQKEVKMFAYPMGRFNPKVKKAVKSANFLGARTLGELNSKVSDPLEFGVTLGTNPLTLPLSPKGRGNTIYPSPPKGERVGVRGMSWFWAASLSAKARIESKTIWHLAGHAWEIEDFGMWKILERLFKYIQRLDEKLGLVNSEVIQKWHETQKYTRLSEKSFLASHSQ